MRMRIRIYPTGINYTCLNSRFYHTISFHWYDTEEAMWRYDGKNISAKEAANTIRQMRMYDAAN